MTLPPSPEAQIDVQAIKARAVKLLSLLDATEAMWRAGLADLSSTEAEREEASDGAVRSRVCSSCIRELVAVLDAYEVKVRDNATLVWERERLMAKPSQCGYCAAIVATGAERAHMEACEQRPEVALQAEVATLTAALAEARKERDEARAEATTWSRVAPMEWKWP
jgi:hypothetical protein